MEYMIHYHQARPPQGPGYIVLMPAGSTNHDASRRYREPFGGLLHY